MSAGLIQCDRGDGIWRVSIARPKKANALTEDMLQQLSDIFGQVKLEGDLKVLVITGAGDRVFCAGADLSELSNYTVDQSDTLWDDMANTLAMLPILTIAKINGPCIGGGLTLALSCDIRIAVRESVFEYPAHKNNVLPGNQDFERLRQLIGPGRTATLLLGGLRIDASEAHSWGLIDRLSDRESLDLEVDSLCEAALAGPKSHLGLLKQHCWDNNK